MSVENIAPPIPKGLISNAGTKVKIIKAALKKDIKTSMGKLDQALTIEVKIDGNNDTFSHLFGLDSEVISGSVGRILSSINVKNITDLDDKKLKELVNKTFNVVNRSDKLYWN